MWDMNIQRSKAGQEQMALINSPIVYCTQNINELAKELLETPLSVLPFCEIPGKCRRRRVERSNA